MTEEHAARHTKVVAFYSHADGSGRSCTLANLSLILASWGYRVLVADLNAWGPAMHRYLAPFLPAEAPEHGNVPIRLACHFDDLSGSVDFLGPVSDPVADLPDFRVRRGDLVQPDWDFVLLDTAAGPQAVPVITELADVVLLGYTLNTQAIAQTVTCAGQIRASDRGTSIQVLPVPMKIQRNAGATTSRALATARLQFSSLLDDIPDEQQRNYWNSIEIPYEPDYSIDEGLAYLDGPSEQRDSLVRSYRELAAQIARSTPHRASGTPTPQTLTRYKAARMAAANISAAVTVLHAPADRYWAEWVSDELRGLGLTATRRRVDAGFPAGSGPGSVLLVVSESLTEFPGSEELLSRALAPASPADQRIHLGLSIDGTRLPRDRFPALAPVSLDGNNAEQTRQELASFYKLSRAPGDQRTRQSRYPASAKDSVASLPDRVGVCRGRDDEIDAIRDHFTASGTSFGPAPLTLIGEPGIGKTCLALEYAYRFAASYDLVVLIRSDSEHAVRADLRVLARMAGSKPSRAGGDSELNVLRHLRTSPHAPERWLLIYDGADSPQALSGLLPGPGRGHVLLTRRASAADSSAELPVRALAPDAARDMLTDLAHGLLPAEAAGIAQTLGGVPLAIQLAAGWLREMIRHLVKGGINQATVVGNAVRELGDQLGSERGAGSGPPDHVAAMVELLLRLLQTAPHAAAGLLLLETCAFLSSAGLSGRLLRSPVMLQQLTSADKDLTDLVVLNNVRQTLVNLGFAPANLTAQQPLRLHPRVQEILRHRMPPDDRRMRSLAVTQMLAASVPADVDDDVIGHTAVYSELLQHMDPSGALQQTDDDVRRWLVGQVRFLWQLETANAWRTARDLAERLAARWAATVTDGEDDHLLLRLRVQLANVYRSQCEFEKARLIDADALHKQRRVLGPGHLRTLMTARSYGADLRLAGKFEESLNIDNYTYQAFRDALGDEHLMTIVASSNMALAELMAGDPQQALERQQADIARCDKISSERPWQKAWVQFHVGTLQREIGRYEESRITLVDARAEFDTLVARRRLEPTVWAVLRTAAGLAITERRLGVPNIAATRGALQTCLDAYGDEYPDVLALELSLAGDLYALGRHEEAAQQGEKARSRYGSVFGADHPFTRVCEVDLSGYALAAGQFERARALSATALSALAQELPEGHLWVQAAKIARANVLAAGGRPEEALRLEAAAHAAYQQQFGSRSGLASIAAANMEITRRLLAGADSVPGEGLGPRAMIELDTPPY